MSGHRFPWQRVLIEAMTAASALIDEDMRKEFVVIGGAALVQYGSIRKTRDVDIAVTPQSLNMFENRAGNDSRFSKDADGRWAYTCEGTGIEDLRVEFEFLAIGEEFVPTFCGITIFDPVWVASLPDIAVMKANAYENRCEGHDLKDLMYALGEMKRAGFTLAQSGIKKSDIAIIQSAIAGDEERERLFSQVME